VKAAKLDRHARGRRHYRQLLVGGFALALIEALTAKMRIFRRRSSWAPRSCSRAGDAGHATARRLADDDGASGLRAADHLFAAILLLASFAMLAQRRVLSLIGPLRRARTRARDVDRDRRLRDQSAASVRFGRAHTDSEGHPAAVAPLPADPEARREMGCRAADQHSDHDAGRHRAGRLRLQSRRADLAACEHGDPGDAGHRDGVRDAVVSHDDHPAQGNPQVIGFPVDENGLFFAATSATYGMPMVVELGIALDVLVGMLILGVFFFQIREQFDSLDLKHMEKLKESE